MKEGKEKEINICRPTISLSDRDRLKHWRWVVRRIVRYVWKNIKCSKPFGTILCFIIFLSMRSLFKKRNQSVPMQQQSKTYFYYGSNKKIILKKKTEQNGNDQFHFKLILFQNLCIFSHQILILDWFLIFVQSVFSPSLLFEVL